MNGAKFPALLGQLLAASEDPSKNVSQIARCCTGMLSGAI